MKFNFRTFFRSSFYISNFFKLWKEERDFLRDNPDYFLPNGTFIFSGRQGSGKTLTAVRYIKELKERYPKALIVSNVHINGIVYVPYEGIKSLTEISNGNHGVIYLIDEIHLEWNSLDSKSIPIEIFVEVSQQRKQRKHIVGTSQLFTRVAKPFREQVDKVIICKNYLGKFQFNTITDGESITTDKNGELKFTPLKRQWFFHTKEDYNSYDTFEKIKRYGNMQFKATDLFDRYDTRKEKNK